MAVFRIASQTIAEMREFAGFSAEEQFFIERSLEIGRSPLAPCCAPPGLDGAAGQRLPTCSQIQRSGYDELRALGRDCTPDQPLPAIEAFVAALIRVTSLDLARGMIASFAAYRFLYERLLGARVRPFLPASFCAAAALPRIDPATRTQLIESVGQAVLATPGWSMREPLFFPCRLAEDPDEAQYNCSSRAP